MPTQLQSRGETLMSQAVDLVLSVLRQHPEGLTSTEVGRETGLDLDVPKQKGYIAWTVLQHLLMNGRVVRGGRRYRLP